MTAAPKTQAPAQKDKSDEEYRLPVNVHPTHYDLAIKTDLEVSPPHFHGEVRIALRVTKDTDTVVFNAHPSLNVTHIAISGGKGQSSDLPSSALTVDDNTERATLDVSSVGTLKAGSEVTLFLRWDRVIDNNMGYFLSSGDKDENGKDAPCALTQFEPTAARRALPCWDEPLYKATWALTMIHKEGLTALGNMNSTGSNPWKPQATTNGADDAYELGSGLGGDSDGWVITKFDTTPPMSSVYTKPSVVEKGQWPLDVMTKAVAVYEELFDIAYPLPKLDSLMTDGMDGAMENWGLITYRSTSLVDDRTSQAGRQRIAQSQCHEVGHMWFGDIVTMKWWDNLWLNEAFATLMGSLVVPQRLWPDWNMTASFLSVHMVRALTLDALRSSHPIEVELADSSKIMQIFDDISYSKGASVLRMIMCVFGEEKLFKGVSIYLKKHLYKNAETKDLWDGISEGVGQDVASFMHNWVLNTGFPVVTVEENNGELKLTQNRFLATGDVTPQEDETVWWVPLEIKTLDGDKESVDHDAILADRSSTYKVPSDVFKLNGDTIGVYRVAYSPERLVKLGQQAHKFSAADRWGLIGDAAALAAAGISKTSNALGLAMAISAEETDFLPLERVSGLLTNVADVWWENDEISNAIQKVTVKVFHPLVEKLGYDFAREESSDVKELRTLAITSAAQANDKDVIAEFHKRFKPFLENGEDSQIAPEIQRVLFSTVVQHGGEREYNKLMEVYQNSANPGEKISALISLGATADPTLLDKTFALLDNPKAIKGQYFAVLLTALAANRIARHRAVEYFTSHWKTLSERYDGGFVLIIAIDEVFKPLSSKKDLENLKAFIASNDVSNYALPCSQAVDGIQASYNWMSRDTEDVLNWLKNNNYL